MIDVLAEDGIEVVGEEERPQALVLMAGRLRPDAVVLDLLQRSSRELGERVRDRLARDEGHPLGPRRGRDGGPRPGRDHAAAVLHRGAGGAPQRAEQCPVNRVEE